MSLPLSVSTSSSLSLDGSPLSPSYMGPILTHAHTNTPHFSSSPYLSIHLSFTILSINLLSISHPLPVVPSISFSLLPSLLAYPYVNLDVLMCLYMCVRVKV